MDRRSEVINEASAEEVQRDEQRKERCSRVTTAGPSPKLTASTSHELRETPTNLDLNPKNKLLMKSASTAASGSEQQHVKTSSTVAEPEAPIEVLGGNGY